MGIGTSIALIAVGAVFAFALNVRVGGVDIDVVGWILMVAGVVGLLFTTLVTRRSRERTVVRREPADREIVREKPKEREVIRERDPRR